MKRAPSQAPAVPKRALLPGQSRASFSIASRACCFTIVLVACGDRRASTTAEKKQKRVAQIADCKATMLIRRHYEDKFCRGILRGTSRNKTLNTLANCTKKHNERRSWSRSRSRRRRRRRRKILSGLYANDGKEAFVNCNRADVRDKAAGSNDSSNSRKPTGRH